MLGVYTQRIRVNRTERDSTEKSERHEKEIKRTTTEIGQQYKKQQTCKVRALSVPFAGTSLKFSS